MKRLFILVSAALLAFSFNAHAQFYAGGSLGFTSSNLKYEGADASLLGTSFRFTPEFGYKLNDNLSAGIMVGYANGLAGFGSISPSDAYKSIITAASAVLNIYKDPSDYKVGIMLVNPYVRFTLLNSGNFTFGIEGSAAYGSANVKIDNGEGADGKINASLIEIVAKPVITYAITRDLRLVSRLGAAGFQTMSAKAGTEGDNLKKLLTVNNFGIDVSSYNLTLGIEYSFQAPVKK